VRFGKEAGKSGEECDAGHANQAELSSSHDGGSLLNLREEGVGDHGVVVAAGIDEHEVGQESLAVVELFSNASAQEVADEEEYTLKKEAAGRGKVQPDLAPVVVSAHATDAEHDKDDDADDESSAVGETREDSNELLVKFLLLVILVGGNHDIVAGLAINLTLKRPRDGGSGPEVVHDILLVVDVDEVLVEIEIFDSVDDATLILNIVLRDGEPAHVLVSVVKHLVELLNVAAACLESVGLEGIVLGQVVDGGIARVQAWLFLDLEASQREVITFLCAGYEVPLGATVCTV